MGATLKDQANAAVDRLLATMTDDEIADMTDEDMDRIAEGIGWEIVPA